MVSAARWVVAAVLCAALLVACASPGAVPSGADVVPSASAGTTSALSTDQAQLVGVWSHTSTYSESVFKFFADGRFASVEILSQPRAAGVFQATFVREGRVEVDGDRLVLRPSRATLSVEDPDDPAASYTDRPSSLDPVTYRWRVEGGVLILADSSGAATPFRRES